MSRIKKVFQTKSDKILSIYFTAGFPQLNDTVKVLKYLQDAGADMVEIGMPFSDPLADGPVIQDSSQQALKNGMSLKTLFDQLRNCRETIHIPIVLMGYINPVMKFGLKAFLQECQNVGVDGLILPDLPPNEYENQYKPLFNQYGLDNILLVTPETSEKRLQQIDNLSTGFVYAVSASSTTGKDKDWEKQRQYFKRLHDSQLKNPVLTGFGVKDYGTFKAATQYTQGAIIGTAFIKTIANADNLDKSIANFIKQVKEG